jgi:hypothetical protein
LIDSLSAFFKINRVVRFRNHFVEGVAVVKVIARSELGLILVDERRTDLLEKRIGKFEKKSWTKSVPEIEFFLIV